MALVKRVESGGNGLSLPPKCAIENVKRENERKQSVRVCVSSWCLSWLTFVEDDTTKHIPLCQCKLKQWLEEHTRKHTRKVASG